MSDLRNSYDKFYEAEDVVNLNLNLKRWPRNRHEGALKFLNIKRSSKVLDVGCGGGVVLRHLVKKSNFVYGIELSLKRAIKIKNVFNNKVTISEANIEERSEFKENFFDIIILSDVIEHVVNRFDAMKELKRILKPNGIIVILTPNLAKIRNRLRLFFGRYPSTAFENEGYGKDSAKIYDGGHLQYFTFNTLKILADLCKLRIVKSFGCGRFGLFHNIYPELLSGEIGMILRK